MNTTENAQSQVVYVVELVQTDPEGSPTPDHAHYAGERRFPTEQEAAAYGKSLVGKPVPEADFHPCCDWQKRETPITGYNVEADDGT